jgi:replicative DNA helicase
MSEPQTQTPPWSEDAEQAVLSAILIDRDSIVTAIEFIGAEDFYAERHRRLFRAMLHVVGSGAIVDPLTLSDRLQSTGELDAAGGKEYIGFLVDAVPTAANIAYHAGIVREKAQLRRLIGLVQATLNELRRGAKPAGEIVQELQAALSPISARGIGQGFVRVKADLWPMLEELEARQADPSIAAAHKVPTGYPSIDRPLGGGLERGDLLVIAGVPGGCKTAAAMNIAINVAVPFDGTPRGAAVVSAEMTRHKLHMRNLAAIGRIHYSALRAAQLRDEDHPKLARAAGLLSTAPLWVDQTPTPNVEDVIAKCRSLKRENPDLALVVVDFIQLVQKRVADDRRMRDTNRALELTQIAYDLKGMAKELSVAVIATCQVDAADIESRTDKRPRAGDARWSQGMREAADFWASCYRPKMYELDAVSADTLELEFQKARDSELFKAVLIWHGTHLLLTDSRGR